jgi:hypothetical protein
MPLWHQFPHYHLSVHCIKFFCQHMLLQWLFCSFERGIVIPTSDAVLMNLYTQTISYSPLLVTCFPPWNDIFKLWSMYLVKIIQLLPADVHPSAVSSQLNWCPHWFKWNSVSLKDEISFSVCVMFQLHSTTYAYSVLAVIVERATVGQISADEFVCTLSINI